MTRLEPLSPQSGYALEATRQDHKVSLTFMRSVGYEIIVKTTPAFEVQVSAVGISIILESLKNHSRDSFTLSVATLPEYTKSNLRVEHHASFIAQRPNLVYVSHVRSDGSHHNATVIRADAFVKFLEEILAND